MCRQMRTCELLLSHQFLLGLDCNDIQLTLPFDLHLGQPEAGQFDDAEITEEDN